VLVAAGCHKINVALAANWFQLRCIPDLSSPHPSPATLCQYKSHVTKSFAYLSYCSFQSTARNEHQLAAHNTPSTLGINTANLAETPITTGRYGRPPSSMLQLEQKLSGQPRTEPKKNQQTVTSDMKKQNIHKYET
jgi:hypothetical protein